MKEENIVKNIGDIKYETSLEIFAEKRTVLGIINIMTEMFTLNLLQKDPNNTSHMLVYMSKNKHNPEGWYSRNIIDVASECFNNKKNLTSFIAEAEKHNIDTELHFKKANDLLH